MSPPHQSTPPPSSSPPSSLASAAGWWARPLDLTIRTGGLVVAAWGGILLAFYGTFMTPYRIGTVFVPVSVVLVIVGNLALIWFAFFTTRNKWLALVPGLAWIALSFLGADRTTEGDLIMYQANWVGTVYLFAGAGTIAVAAYRLIVPKPPPIVPR